jgi:hypothetical protein
VYELVGNIAEQPQLSGKLISNRILLKHLFADIKSEDTRLRQATIRVLVNLASALEPEHLRKVKFRLGELEGIILAWTPCELEESYYSLIPFQRLLKKPHIAVATRYAVLMLKRLLTSPDALRYHCMLAREGLTPDIQAVADNSSTTTTIKNDALWILNSLDVIQVE